MGCFFTFAASAGHVPKKLKTAPKMTTKCIKIGPRAVKTLSTRTCKKKNKILNRSKNRKQVTENVLKWKPGLLKNKRFARERLLFSLSQHLLEMCPTSWKTAPQMTTKSVPERWKRCPRAHANKNTKFRIAKNAKKVKINPRNRTGEIYLLMLFFLLAERMSQGSPRTLKNHEKSTKIS